MQPTLFACPSSTVCRAGADGAAAIPKSGITESTEKTLKALRENILVRFVAALIGVATPIAVRFVAASIGIATPIPVRFVAASIGVANAIISRSVLSVLLSDLSEEL